MKHALRISVSREPETDNIAAVRQIALRERFLHFLLGSKMRLTVIVPGDSVEELAIKEIPEGGEQREALRN